MRYYHLLTHWFLHLITNYYLLITNYLLPRQLRKLHLLMELSDK
jgi:hypothetical protein